MKKPQFQYRLLIPLLFLLACGGDEPVDESRIAKLEREVEKQSISLRSLSENSAKKWRMDRLQGRLDRMEEIANKADSLAHATKIQVDVLLKVVRRSR